MKKWIAHSAVYCETEEFDDFESAKRWLEKCWSDDNDGYVSDESVDGRDWIAKITHCSTYIIDGKKEDYTENEEGELFDSYGEPYPVSDEFDCYGHLELKSVDESPIQTEFNFNE
jgi:hypothetical protein